jgi:hypothetical protein
MAHRTGHRQRPPEERRAAVTEDLERVDARVQETIGGVSSAVERALEGATQLQETVDAAKAAVEAALGQVHAALTDALDGVKTQVERMDPAEFQQNPWALAHAAAALVDPARATHHPWLLLGGAIIAGYLLGTLERHTAAAPGAGEPPAERPGT